MNAESLKPMLIVVDGIPKTLRIGWAQRVNPLSETLIVTPHIT